MSVTVEEKNSARRSSYNAGERTYLITGAADEDAAIYAMLQTAPLALSGRTRVDNDCEVEEIVDGDIWWGTCQYKSSELSAFQLAGTFKISFDISGVSQHITHARLPTPAAKQYIKPSLTEKYDFKGAIGVNQDGTIEGCDIVIPALTYQLTYTFEDNQITDGYIATLVNAVGSVNSDLFHNHPIGTLLLTCVSGDRRDDKKWDVSFRFAAQPNETSLTVGEITGIHKEGWEYLWVYYAEEPVGETVKKVIPVAQQVNIETVFRKTAYHALGI